MKPQARKKIEKLGDRPISRIWFWILFFIVTIFALGIIEQALAIDFDGSVDYYSEILGGPINFGANFTANNMTWAVNQVRWGNYSMDAVYYWQHIGFRCPANAHMNVTLVNGTHVIMDINQTVNPRDYEMYFNGRTDPSSVTGENASAVIGGIVYFDMTGNGTVIVRWGAATTYNITMDSFYGELEAGLTELLHATCEDGASIQHDDNVTFVVSGLEFTWDEDTERYESTDVENTATTNEYGTLDAFLDTENPANTATIIENVTVTWVTNTMDRMTTRVAQGNWIGAIFDEQAYIVGELTLYTFLLGVFSIGIWNVVGPYGAFIAWLLGWGIFAPQIHGVAQQMALAMFALGVGIMVAKIYLDRRTT
ncbi:hypothetical protein KAU18_09035 [Candidatus Bathyarchaeota archaeon]|nr:hypothetical protein [Candidatus Bathyarchaeota archaeon]